MRFLKNEKMASMTISSFMCTVNAMGKTPHDFTKASVFVLTKHARKITMGLAPEKTIIHRLPIRQFYDACNFLIALTGGTRFLQKWCKWQKGHAGLIMHVHF